MPPFATNDRLWLILTQQPRIYGSPLIESQAKNPMFPGLRWPKPLTRPLMLEPMASLNQLAANRANAQLSTGPTSSEGKAKVSHNALKTGLTGRTVLLPTEDVAAYQAQVERIFKQFSPEDDKEKRL